MGHRTSMRQQTQLRDRIAEGAARLIIENGITDYHVAKTKAAQRLGLGDTRNLPRNDEVERAVEAYQRLFRADRQPQRLRELRDVAVEAMRFLAEFKPRLVGSVLSGTADDHSEVCLHLFADPAESVGLYLLEQGVDHATGERRLRLGADEQARLPTVRFLAGETPVELVVFSGRLRHRAPLSPVDGRPMQRASLARVESLNRPGC